MPPISVLSDFSSFLSGSTAVGGLAGKKQFLEEKMYQCLRQTQKNTGAIQKTWSPTGN